jgi:epoxyqueuosine reductase
MLRRFVEEASRLGFLATGFSRVQTPLYFDHFCAWIAAGKHGDMGWLEQHTDLRRDPGKLLQDCKTVVSLAYPYPRKKPTTSDGFAAARYSQPGEADYHKHLRRISKTLTEQIHACYPGSDTRVCVDSAPILERSFAYAAGIGFIGKNNMLIIPGYGSYFFLVEILTTAPLEFPPNRRKESQCGSCSRCVEACPTGALEGAFSLNATKCLSYTTIEHKGRIEAETAARMGVCFFGCDVCQEVCPFNEGAGKPESVLPSTDRILEMNEEDFQIEFGNTAFARGGLKRIKANIRALRSITSKGEAD